MKKPPVKSIRHKGQKRVHIPSGEEAGYESASPVVQAKDEAKFPKNRSSTADKTRNFTG
jgi:hypothetical protein